METKGTELIEILIAPSYNCIKLNKFVGWFKNVTFYSFNEEKNAKFVDDRNVRLQIFLWSKTHFEEIIFYDLCKWNGEWMLADVFLNSRSKCLKFAPQTIANVKCAATGSAEAIIFLTVNWASPPIPVIVSWGESWLLSG